MISIHSNKLKNTLPNYRDEIETHIEDVTSKLKTWVKNRSFSKKGTTYQLTKSQEFYLRYLMSKTKRLVYCDHDKIEKYSKVFDRIIPESKKGRGSAFTSFKNRLIEIMGYEKLRSKEDYAIYPQFFRDLGLKACVYCNSQLTITANSNRKKSIGRFQVDHYIDKASYPCFSLTFSNLYPVCASCNNKKGNKAVGFKLYSDNPFELEKSHYQFSLDRASIANYRISKNDSELAISFDDAADNLNDIFSIEGIYATQKDLAAEIISKSEVYNESYKNSMRKSFNKLYGRGNASINFNRFILGNYADEKDIHKRPMAKFTIDLAKQLKLIP